MSVTEDRARLVAEHLRASSDALGRAAESLPNPVAQASAAIIESLRHGGKMLVCGNGGSAADSQHFAAEFVGHFEHGIERPGMAAVALTTDSSILTAIANDDAFDLVFERQVQALGRNGDVLVCISTSGNSRNVLNAARAARKARMTIVTLSGQGGALTDLADIAVSIPGSNGQLVQEVMLAVEHCIVGAVERSLYPAAEDA